MPVAEDTTPRRAALTRPRIVALALGIIDEDGLEALNMRRLAAEAGVKPMSLYHHFASKQAILDAVGESIAAAALGASPPDSRWRSRVRQLFMGLHALTEAHPRALPLISAAVVRTPSGRRWMEELMATLLGAGFSEDRAATVYHVLGAYTLGLGYARMLGDEVQTTEIVAQLVGQACSRTGKPFRCLLASTWQSCRGCLMNVMYGYHCEYCDGIVPRQC